MGTEYIEKQVAMDAVNSVPAANWVSKRYTEELERIPPADVRPMVRGRWIPFTSEAAGDIWYCSACDIGFAHRTDFCPNCGADMREA